MIIIFCDSVIDNKTVEPDYLNEWNAANTAVRSAALVSFKELFKIKLNSLIAEQLSRFVLKERNVFSLWN